MPATKVKSRPKSRVAKAKMPATKDGRQPGFSFVNPCFAVKNPAKEIDYLVRAFGFKKGDVMVHEGQVAHAELSLGTSKIMLGPENPKFSKSALTLGGSPMSLYLYVKDVDATTKRAREAGGTVVQEPTDQFWGDRTAAVLDPEGLTWYVATYTGKFSKPDFSGCCDQ